MLDKSNLRKDIPALTFQGLPFNRVTRCDEEITLKTSALESLYGDQITCTFINFVDKTLETFTSDNENTSNPGKFQSTDN